MTSQSFVTSNDRDFACDGASCGVDDRGLHSAIGTVDLDAEFLDTDRIRDNLRELIASVSDAVSNVFVWIDNMEHEFAIKYAANEIASDVLLFNQINVTIVKIKRLKSSLNLWLSNFHQLILDTADMVNEYNIASSVLRTESITSHANIMQSAVSLAKQNVGKSRSLGKKIKQILKLDSNIKRNMVRIQSQIESFYTGVIRVNDKIINFHDFEQDVLALSGGNSPLAQIQTKLANEINSSRQPFVLKSSQPVSVKTPQENCIYGTCELSKMPAMKTEKLIERLSAISTRVLYTDVTKSYLDQVIESAIALSKNSNRLIEVTRIAQKIKNNTPNKVIDYFRANVRNPAGQFARIDQLKQIIANLQGDDITYGPILKSIADETEQNAKSNLLDDSMDVVFENTEDSSIA